MSAALSSFYSRRVVITVWGFRAAPFSSRRQRQEVIVTFYSKDRAHLSPSGYVFNIRALVTLIPRFKKDPCQDQNITDRDHI